MTAGEYRVQTPVFSGPMDLLLHLVQSREVEASELPLAPIAEEFLAHAATLSEVNLDQSGEFIEVASTLMEIKSRELLPDPTPEEARELAELRSDLIERLLEYRGFREAASALSERWAVASERFARAPVWPESAEPSPSPPAAATSSAPLSGVEVWDLVQAFSRILRETGGARAATVRYEDVPIVWHMERVLAEMDRAGDEGRTFRELAGEADRLWVIGLFLALLELVRLSKIRVIRVRHDPEGSPEAIRIVPRNGQGAVRK